MYNDNIYTFGTDNYVHINLGKGIKKSKDVISIITNKDSVLLKSGNYYFSSLYFRLLITLMELLKV